MCHSECIHSNMGSSELRWASCLGPLEKFWKIMTWRISQVHILSYHVQIFINMMRQPVENLRLFSVCNQTQHQTGRSSFSVPMWDKCNLFQQLLILSLPTNQPTFYGHCTGQPALITGGFCSCKVFCCPCALADTCRNWTCKWNGISVQF